VDVNDLDTFYPEPSGHVLRPIHDQTPPGARSLRSAAKGFAMSTLFRLVIGAGLAFEALALVGVFLAAA
jgi:hypothetical protein